MEGEGCRVKNGGRMIEVMDKLWRVVDDGQSYF